MALRNFYVSFGIGYATTEHPYWPGAHPDGYLEVIAPDEDAARALVRSYIGLKWGHMYDRKPEWARAGRLATITEDGVLWPKEGVEPPTPKFTAQDPQYWGHEADEVICARIEGILAENSSDDALSALGYEAEFVHHGCFQEGVALFQDITDVDYRVLACELDWSEQDQYECAVCQEGIL